MSDDSHILSDAIQQFRYVMWNVNMYRNVNFSEGRGWGPDRIKVMTTLTRGTHYA